MNKSFGEIIRDIKTDAKAAQKEKLRAEKRKIAVFLMLPLLKSNKYKSVRYMAKLLIKDFLASQKGVKNHLLAKCLGTKFRGSNPAMTKQSYLKDKRHYNELIGNRLRTLKKTWSPNGYGIKFTQDSTQIIQK